MGIFRGLLIDLLRSVKAQYMAADPAGKATVLSVVLDEVVLRPDDSYISWREPCGMLFGLSRVIKKSEWVFRATSIAAPFLARLQVAFRPVVRYA